MRQQGKKGKLKDENYEYFHNCGGYENVNKKSKTFYQKTRNDQQYQQFHRIQLKEFYIKFKYIS